jgi:hypothetical protein
LHPSLLGTQDWSPCFTCLFFGRAFPRLGRNHTTVGTPRPIPLPGRPEYRPLQLHHHLQLLCLQSPVESRTQCSIPSLYIFITPAPSTRNRPCLSSPPALPEHTPRLCCATFATATTCFSHPNHLPRRHLSLTAPSLSQTATIPTYQSQHHSLLRVCTFRSCLFFSAFLFRWPCAIIVIPRLVDLDTIIT